MWQWQFIMALSPPSTYGALARVNKYLATVAKQLRLVKERQWYSYAVTTCPINDLAVDYLSYFVPSSREQLVFSNKLGRCKYFVSRVQSYRIRALEYSLDVQYLKTECYVAHLSCLDYVCTVYSNSRGYYCQQLKELHYAMEECTIHATPKYREYSFSDGYFYEVRVEDSSLHVVENDESSQRKIVRRLEERKEWTKIPLLQLTEH